MTDLRALAATLRGRAGDAKRFMVAIAGAPAAGKSTISAGLRDELIALGESAVVVPMDGFHLDDIILNARGYRPRKGAPFTFDVTGFETLLKRIQAGEPEIFIPVFDRSLELSRNAADIVASTTRFILIEGNYLLLDETPWNRLQGLFDYSIALNVPLEVLERRLIQRWLDHGFDMAYATNWIASNDLPNIKHVIAHSGGADLTI